MLLNSSPKSFGAIKVRLPLVAPGQRIGIMGGSFNPPHTGHVRVAETALRRLGLAQVWWVVTPGNPLKSRGALKPLATRMLACRQMARPPHMVVTDFEDALGTPFTAATLGFLMRRHRAVRFVWVMGADNLATFHRWQSWRAIAASIPIVVVDRPGWRLAALASPAARALAQSRLPETRALKLANRQAPAWTFLSTRLSDLSSTVLRNQAQIRARAEPH